MSSSTDASAFRAALRAELNALAEPAYRDFQSALIPDLEKTAFLGVRLPALRRISRRIIKGDWRAWLREASDASFEEILLQGMVIGLVPVSKNDSSEFHELLSLIERYLPKITNWSLCDSFCSSLKITRTYPEEMWEFLKQYRTSSKEYELRFAAVMDLNYYLEEAKLPEIFQTFTHIGRQSDPVFYARMAAAWAASLAYVSFPDETLRYLTEECPDRFIVQKALQKILESRQVAPEQKEEIRAIKAAFGKAKR